MLGKILDLHPPTAKFVRLLRDALDRSEPATITPWGFKLAGHANMATGKFEPEETELLRRLLPHFSLLINVGANVGYYCCHALSQGVEVIAIEPLERNLHYLLRNISVNGWSKNCEVFPVAAGAASDILTLWGGGTGASFVEGWAGIPSSYSRQVPVLSLDRLIPNDRFLGGKSLLIIDVEGAEKQVLEGAKRLLHEVRPTCLVEVCWTEHQPLTRQSNPDFYAVFDLMFSVGYRAWTADGTWLSIGWAEVRNILQGGLQLATHNFLFVHQDDDILRVLPSLSARPSTSDPCTGLVSL